MNSEFDVLKTFSDGSKAIAAIEAQIALATGWPITLVRETIQRNAISEKGNQYAVAKKWIDEIKGKMGVSINASGRECLTFKTPSGDTHIVPVDRLVFNEHTSSQTGTTYFFKAMGELETDPYNSSRISQTTAEELNRYKRLYSSVPVTFTSSD